MTDNDPKGLTLEQAAQLAWHTGACDAGESLLCGWCAALLALAEIDALKAELVDYESLRKAVNDGPDCTCTNPDAYIHEEGCPAIDMAQTLIALQKEHDALKAAHGVTSAEANGWIKLVADQADKIDALKAFPEGDRAVAQANIDGWKSRCLAAEAERDMLRAECERIQAECTAHGLTRVSEAEAERDALKQQAEVDRETMKHMVESHDERVAERDALKAENEMANRNLTRTIQKNDAFVMENDRLKAERDALSKKLSAAEGRANFWETREDETSANLTRAVEQRDALRALVTERDALLQKVRRVAGLREHGRHCLGPELCEHEQLVYAVEAALAKGEK